MDIRSDNMVLSKHGATFVPSLKTLHSNKNPVGENNLGEGKKSEADYLHLEKNQVDIIRIRHKNMYFLQHKCLNILFPSWSKKHKSGFPSTPFFVRC